MAQRNLTVRLDEDVVKKAKVLAAQRSTSVSGLVSAEIERLVGQEQAYTLARTRAQERLRKGFALGGPPYPARDEVHERG